MLFSQLLTHTQRLFEREALKLNRKPAPETRLYMGQAAGVLVPLSLHWLAFTT